MMNTNYKTADDWKRQIILDVKRREERRKKNAKLNKKQKQQAYFDKAYDKLKSVEFKSRDELNMEKYFIMPKMVKNRTKEFFYGSHNGLAIYPVLCGRADFLDDSKWVRISRENIGKLAGISTKCVDKGVERLMQLDFRTDEITIPFLQRRQWQDKQRRGYEYLMGFFRYSTALDPRKWRGRYFTFHTCIVKSGIWARLSRKAKALYLAMRSTSFFDQLAYEHIEGIWIPTIEEIYDGAEVTEVGKQKYRDRKWDVCNTTLKKLFSLARIPYRDTRQIVDELEEVGLVERVHEHKSVFKVYLRPKSLLKNL